jgi:hypothetical protein
MEQFFTPTRPLRHQGLFEESTHGDDPLECTEVRLAVGVGDFLVYNWDWKELRAFLTGGVAPNFFWITEFAFLVVKESGHVFDFDDDMLIGRADAIFQEASGQQQKLVLGHLLGDHLDSHLRAGDDADIISYGVAGIFWRVITTSNIIQLRIDDDKDTCLSLPSGPLLSKFLRESLSLQALEFDGLEFEGKHFRALATLERQDLEVELRACTLHPHYAKETFIEWFRHNQVVTELDCCDMDCSILGALNGNKSVKKLTIARSSSKFAEMQIRAVAQALPGNMGIEHLSLNSNEISDENWSLLFRSLATHPRIKLLSLSNIWMALPQSAESKRAMMNAVLQMLQCNTVVRPIELPDAFSTEEVYQNAILPRLEMNCTCFEVQRQAVKRADPSIRPQLLGRALHVVRYNPNLVFQFLSENVPAFVRTEEEEEDSAIPLENDPAILSRQKRKAPS